MSSAKKEGWMLKQYRKWSRWSDNKQCKLNTTETEPQAHRVGQNVTTPDADGSVESELLHTPVRRQTDRATLGNSLWCQHLVSTHTRHQIYGCFFLYKRNKSLCSHTILYQNIHHILYGSHQNRKHPRHSLVSGYQRSCVMSK